MSLITCKKFRGGGNSLKLGVKSEELGVGGSSSIWRFGGLLAFLFSVAFSFDAAAFSVCAVGDSITQGGETTSDIVIYGAPREMTLVNSAVSPDGKNEIRLYSNPLAYEVMRDGIVVVAKTEIGLKMNGKCVKEGVTKPCAVRPAKFSGFAPTSVYKKGKLDLSGNETLILNSAVGC